MDRDLLLSRSRELSSQLDQHSYPTGDRLQDHCGEIFDEICGSKAR